MTEQATELTPAMAASLASWRCVQSHDREGWLALMAADVVIEDPIGTSITNPDGMGIRGKDAVAAFYDTNIAVNNLTVTCEESFPSSSANEVAHIMVLRSEFEGGVTSAVRGVFCYRVDDEGLITNLRGYWNLAGMQFGQAD
ncbi:MAG: ketosteroid isomerase family protein [Actinomycetia bacterium]|nr:ketosteroid isomerase family protein [Actinomycetes bacterium]